MNRFISLCTFCIVFVFSAQLRAEEEPKLKHPLKPFLWEIKHEKLKGKAYLFGAPNYPSPKTIKLHPAVEKAFDKAEICVFGQSLSEEGIKIFFENTVRDDGRKLKDIIGADLHQKIDIQFSKQAQKFDLQWVENIKILSMMSLYQWQVHPHKKLGTLQQKLWNTAKLKKKSVESLSIVSEMFEKTDAISHNLKLSVLRTVVDLDLRAKAQGSYIGDIESDIYFRGNVEELPEYFKKNFESEMYDEDQAELLRVAYIKSHNEKLTEGLDKILSKNSKKSSFATVGIFQLVGEGSILERLKEKGYTLELKQ